MIKVRFLNLGLEFEFIIDKKLNCFENFFRFLNVMLDTNDNTLHIL